MASPKYPRTAHLPWSPGGTNDDKRLERAGHFVGEPLTITEKMDGSGVCLERSAVYSRSHSDPPSHPSFDLLKQLHAQIRFCIPKEVQVFGEWLYARHSIIYHELPSYLQVFGVRHLDSKLNYWASWEEVEIWAEELGVSTVPVLANQKCFGSEDNLRKFTLQLVRPGREGVVVRLFDEFPDDRFHMSIAKFVRADHIQTDGHWSHREIIRNSLKKV